MSELGKLLDCVRCGDKAAFAALYEEMKKPTFTIILRITRDFALAEDVMQELFLKIYLLAPVNVKNPRAYICRMARNLALDSVRRIKPESGLETAEMQSWRPQDDLTVRLDIENAIMELAERDRMIVTLHINGGLRFREVAEVMEIPLGTVLWAYRKAIGQLRSVLGGMI